MQQRRLRLGDILDDYCPRERRITNHVVVAMIDDAIKQTRCTTCDAEHEYKQAKAPAPRRKKTGALFQEVLEDARPRAVSVARPESEPEPDPLSRDTHEIEPEPVDAAPAPAPLADTMVGDESEEAPADDRLEDDGPVHRRLIRATLPRPEGQAPEWKEPEFTMRQPANGNRHGQRARGHRPVRHAQDQPGNQNRFGGQRHGGGGARQGAQGQGHGQGQRQGNRPGQPSSHRGNNRPPGGGQHRGQGRKRGR